MFGQRRKDTLEALGIITAIATDYIYEGTDITNFSVAVAKIADYLNDPEGEQVIRIASRIAEERHPANNSSPIVGGDKND